MKKSKLIELLNSIEGNPDIVLWNGMVGDWMDIAPKLVEGDLVKESFQMYLRQLEMEKKRKLNDFEATMSSEEVADAKKWYKKEKFDWETNAFVTHEDIASGSYNVKRVFYIDAKPRGVDTWDRLGNISY